MFAIAFLFFILLYLLIGILIAVGITKLFNVNGAKKTIIIVVVLVFMLGLVFWDWLPMEISYKNKCDNEAGLTIYKTLDDWKRENPGVWETLSARVLPDEYLVKEQMYKKSGIYEEHGERYYQLPDGTKLTAHFYINGGLPSVDVTRKDGSKAYRLNQRFLWDTIYTGYYFHIYKRTERIIDMKTNEVIASEVNFGTSAGSLYKADTLKDYKFWMKKRTCWKKENKGKWLVNGYAFSQLKDKLRNIKGL